MPLSLKGGIWGSISHLRSFYRGSISLSLTKEVTCTSRESNLVPWDPESEDQPTRLFRHQQTSSLRNLYASKIQNWCPHARRGFFRCRNSDFLFVEHIKNVFWCFGTQNKPQTLPGSLTLPPEPPGRDLGGLRHDFFQTASNGIRGREFIPGYPRIPRISPDPVHDPRLGTTLPRAPGVRMTSSNILPQNI